MATPRECGLIRSYVHGLQANFEQMRYHAGSKYQQKEDEDFIMFRRSLQEEEDCVHWMFVQMSIKSIRSPLRIVICHRNERRRVRNNGSLLDT
ncbi:hypothetical protein NDU88_004444 [Pleurodeles waltl]|uniref:Uncharacterized protein n=1 Tax=Pleurodeles waltl TaxID=8319 RepID=A0AAV7TRH5_PLEWA|nr:hypothetical protein NDU88_004444 [Pleurodeles waltl]